MRLSLSFIFLGCFCLVSHASTDSINRGNGAEPDSLDIHQAQGLNSQNILMDMYEGLMSFDVHGIPQYGVAANHEVNSDFTVWTFNLKPNAKWSDGLSVTANDFIQAWKLAINPNTAAPYKQLFDNMMTGSDLNVESDHPLHLRITLNQADAGLLHKLVLPIFYPLPDANANLSVSNGAYFLQKWDIQERIELVKNPYFHAAQEVKTSHINYWVTENQNSELLRFRAGDLDITETIPDSQILWLRENLAKELRIAPYFGTFFLGLNLQDNNLGKQKLRQALSLSIDRRILVDKVLKTGQVPANQIVPPAGIVSDVTTDPGFDLQKAQQLLQQSGFNRNTDKIEILYNNSDNQKKVALAIAAMWRQHLGVKSKLKNQEWKMFVNTRKGNNKQAFRSGWIADYHDPLNFLDLFHSQSHFNFYAFEQQAYDVIIDQLRRSYDPIKKAKLVTQAEQLLAEQLPVIPLYHYVSRHLVNTAVSGFIDNEMDRHLSRYLAKKAKP
ncbi:MAG: peptide ABC transporter substrate-binding protein [Marinicella sp.]